MVLQQELECPDIISCSGLSEKSGDNDLALAAVVREVLPHGGRGTHISEAAKLQSWKALQ